MPNYDLNRLNNSEFEHLVQALSTKIFNYENIVFGAGPDGAREATFEGTCTVPGENPIDGYYVIQAKFKDCSTPQDKKDWKWAKNELEKEIVKFRDIERKLKTPDVYLFFTNIQFTSVSKTGGRDKIEEFKKTHLDLIPNIRIYGYDDLCKFLDNNRDVATSYASFILPGDILQSLYQSMQVQDEKDQKILYRFLNKEFEEDLYSKLEQANELTDKKVNLDKVFVDLNIVEDNSSDENNQKFVSYCIDIGNNILKEKQYKMVFIGGPGQGKSTVTQFLTQIYRAYFLKSFNNTLSEDVRTFLQRNVDADKQPQCYRFPIRIVLSDYSEWINTKRNEGTYRSILSYIQDRIELRAEEKFSEFSNFRTLLEKLSFLFIFDGLDEVPATSNRGEIITEIDNFINHELHGINCDALIIATTRPQGYSNEFDRTKFKHFRLDDLDDETCLKYLEKLIKNTIVSSDDRTKQLKILKDALSIEVTSNIMRTPLQATIMAILVKSGGKPSKDKFSLFNDYYLTILKREKQKNVLNIISEHEEYINDIHYRLGNTLQQLSQSQENSSSYLDIDNFKILVEKYFIDQELEKGDQEKYTKEIMEAITDRLVFITENQDKKIGFAIRSTQEYFSAMMNVHNRSDEEVRKNIKIIGKSIYWRNVYVFMLGYIVKNKVYMLDYLDSYLGELNGSTLLDGEHSANEISKYGALLALEILSESILSNLPREENKFIKHLQGLTDVIAPKNTDHLLHRLNIKIIDKGLISILERSLNNQLHNRISSWKIIAELAGKNEKVVEHFYRYWPGNEEEELYCLILFVENRVFSEFILEKFYKYLNWKNFKKIESALYEVEFIDMLVNSNNIHSNDSAKNFLIEYIYILSGRAYGPIETIKYFFKLLNISSDIELDNLIVNEKFLTNIGPLKASIFQIKDLRENELILELHDVTSKNPELSLLKAFFHYLYEPSENTLQIYFYEIKKKIEFISINLFDNSFGSNWQLRYIKSKLYIGVSDEEILSSINTWGSSFEEYIEYEERLNKIDNLLQNSDFIAFEYENHEDKISCVEFYKQFYEKDQISLHRFLLISFIFEVKDIDNDFQRDEMLYEIIEEVVRIINEDKGNDYLNFLVKTLIIVLLSQERLIRLEQKLNSDDIKIHSLHSFVSDDMSLLAINKLINIIEFKSRESNFIEIVFEIIMGMGTTDLGDNVYRFNMFFELDYHDVKLQRYGYLLSLLHPEIHNDISKMKTITEFLTSKAKLNDKVFEDTKNFIMKNRINNSLVENLLIQMYQYFKKDRIEDCLLAAQYENSFKNLFENQVIEV